MTPPNCFGPFHQFERKEEKIDNFGRIRVWVECPCGVKSPKEEGWSKHSMDLVWSHIALLEEKLRSMESELREHHLLV